MDTPTDQVVEPTNTPTEPTPQDPTPAEPTGLDTLPAEPTPAEPAPAEPPAWEPNLKYKVKDDEHDMPEWAHKLITNADVEKEMKTLFSKGHGIEDIKQSRQTLRDELAEIKEQKESIDQSLNTLSEYVQNGDMRSFFEALQIPKDLVMKYAIEELKYQELPAEQKAAIDNQRQVSQQLQQLQYQNQTLQQTHEQQKIAQKDYELSVELSKPDIVQQVQAFDARNGVGAFRREVINQGVLAFHTQNIELTTEDAVKKVLGLIGAYSSPAEPAATPPQPQVQDPAKVDKPVIPNVQSQGGSPVRKGPESLADLRKMAEQAAAQA